jgi:hypothetical protein
MIDLDDVILNKLSESEYTVTELEMSIKNFGSNNRIDKRINMLRKWGLVDYRTKDVPKGCRGKKPLSYSLSKKAKELLKNRCLNP